jgi:hypothetical protein
VKQGLECARRTPPQLCEKDPDGGHCVTATEDELACIVNCVKLGNPPGECNAACAVYRWLPLKCYPEKQRECAYYTTPSKCEPDPIGGHCVTIPGYDQLKENYDYCRTNTECKSGICEGINFLDLKYISIGSLQCLPPRLCRPGTTIGPDGNSFSSCGTICSEDGREWLLNSDDCTSSKPRYTRYCKDNIVVYEDMKENIRLYGQECDAGCYYGACITNTTYRCQEGEFSYVKGSCSGISGCPDSSQNYSGNCLAKCNTDGNWEITSACKGISIESDFSNQERFKVLRSLANYPAFDFPIKFVRHNNAFVYDYAPSNAFLRKLLEKFLAEHPDPACAYAYANGQINIADCGTTQHEIAHEIAHLILSDNPTKLSNYKIEVGCRQHPQSSEVYTFDNEPPVNWGATNCSQGFAYAASYYQTAPCEMKTDFPIQYKWMKNNIYQGNEFCLSGQSHTPINNSFYPSLASSQNKSSLDSYSDKSDQLDSSFLQKISDKFSFTPLVHAQTTVPHKLSLNVGSILSEVKSELGNPDETHEISGLTILVYNTSNSSLPNTFFFNSENKLIYFRLLTNNLKFNFRTIDRWLTDYGDPQAVASSNVQTYSTKLMYPNSGFTAVVDDNSKKIIQYESFIPINQDEYLDTWGIDIYQSKVKPPKITPTPTPGVGGDGDGNGDVDVDDYVILLNNINTSTTQGSSSGDFNGDNTVDGLDYIIWLNNYGT